MDMHDEGEKTQLKVKVEENPEPKISKLPFNTV